MEQYKKILGKVMMTAEGPYNKDKKYKPISLVTDEETDKSYISRKEVPAGIQINNREYWQPVASSGIIDNGVIILNRKNSDGQIPIYDLKSATETVAAGDRKAGVILGFLGFNPETDTVPTWRLYQYNDVSPSNWTNIDYWLSMDYTNKYAGWFDNEEALYDSVPFPKVGMYAYIGNSASSAIVYRCYNDRIWQPTEDKAFTGVVNLADEEDITSKQNKLKFKDKEYNPAQYNGMGRIYLRKNIVDGKNVLTQIMMQATNTIYIIQYDYDLQDETITVPSNCVLYFEGGSFNNGIINFNNTYLEGIPNFNNIYYKEGSITNDEVEINWFGIDNTGRNDETNNVYNLTKNVLSHAKIIKFSGIYLFSSQAININRDANSNSNGYIKLEGKAKFIFTNNHGVFINIHSCNVDIENIDVESSDEEAQNQWGITDENISEAKRVHCFYIYGTGTLNVNNVNISHVWGNAFSLSWGFRNINFNNIRLVDVGGRISTLANDSHGDGVYFNFDTFTNDKSPIFININNFYMYGKYNEEINEFSRTTFKFELLSDRNVKNPNNINLSIDNLYSYGTNNVLDIEGFMDTYFIIDFKNSILDKHRKIIYTTPGAGWASPIKAKFNNIKMRNIGGVDFITPGVNSLFISHFGDNFYIENCNIETSATFGGNRGDIYIKNTNIDSIHGWWIDGVKNVYAENCTFKVISPIQKLIANLTQRAIFENCKFEADSLVTVQQITDTDASVIFNNCKFNNVAGISNNKIFSFRTLNITFFQFKG